MLAFMFPGQGSQRPGMGASWVEHPSFELVDAASEVAGRDVAALLLHADEEELRLTQNAQLATFVLSLVVLDAAERLGLEPSVCAGHSLGEYSALVASGSLSFEDGVRLVAERGLAMAEAATDRPGTMRVVLGLDDDAVESACVRAEGDCWVANYNSPGQVVIAGDPEALDRAAAIATELGARRVMAISVGGAFHTPFMTPARERLRKALAESDFHVPEPVVVANVDARAHDDPKDWAGLLSAQLCSPVRWRQSLQTCAELGARTFAELGPGGVLAGLVKRTLEGDDFKAASVATPAELEALITLVAASVVVEPTERIGDTFVIQERLIVSPATGRFRPAEAFAAAGPTLQANDTAGPELSVAVGDLIGWAGDTEIRSAFAGDLGGVLVLAGERVLGGQAVAWIRAAMENA